MNYGEELAYWYLRFNGFFPLTNFVLHTNATYSDPSDCDILAIRHPFVYEDVGGQEDDWDPKLRNFLDFNCIVGVICEVKTSSVRRPFPDRNIEAGIDRFGFFADSSNAKKALLNREEYSEDNYQIVKLLIANQNRISNTRRCFLIPLPHARNFIKGHIRKYLQDKYAQRFFFKSTLIQEIIAEIHAERFAREDNAPIFA
jgi:hypothetical protein